MPSDNQSNHGETHAACNERLEREGGKARCCYCVPHGYCKLNDAYDMHIEGDTVVSPDPSDTNTDVGLLEQVEEIKNFCRINYAPDAMVSDEYEEQWTSRVKRLIADRERAAKKEVLQRVITLLDMYDERKADSDDIRLHFKFELGDKK